MRIALLPDTRPEAGLGHLRRCQALASALEALGCECIFPQRGSAFEAEVLVADCYDVQFDGSLYRGILSALVHFDDGMMLNSPADIVINGAPGAESLPYKLRDGATALLGPQYLCLDPAIASAPKREPQPEVKNILVSLGYAPDQDLLHRVAVAVSKAAPDAVVQTLHSAPPGMLILLLNTWADLAITGGGQTMLESVALGVPTIAVCMGENQRAQVEALHVLGVVHYAGGEMGNPEHWLTGNVQALTSWFIGDVDKRRRMSEAGRRLIDGRGAERVARAIVDCIERGA